MHKRPLRIVAQALLSVLAITVELSAQAVPTEEHFKTGVAQIEAGDFLIGLMTLNEVVVPASNADLRTVARAHVYRAQANLGLRQPLRARTAALLALKADASVIVTAPQFSAAVVTLFEELRRPGGVDWEATGLAAEKSGRYDEAFTAYLNAFQALPDPAPAGDDHRLRERIIEVVARLETRPAIPQEASNHLAKATQLLEAEALFGGAGTASSAAAAAELRQAIRFAPWWPDATFKLAGLLQKLQRLDEAVTNLNLYRLADPDGYAAAVAAKRGAAVEKPQVSPRAIAPAPMGAIYVYWPPQARLAGGKVRCDGIVMADLEEQRFVLVNVAPGRHEIALDSTVTNVTVHADRTYYVRGATEGFPEGTRLREVSADEGTSEIREKQVTENDPRLTYRSECAAAQGRGASH